MNKKKVNQISKLLIYGKSKKEIIEATNLSIKEVDEVIKKGLSLYADQLEEDEVEFNLQTKMFSNKGFENNIDFICARIETDPDFSIKEILDLGEKGIETNWDLIRLKHPLQRRIKNHFTIPVKFPIVFSKKQEKIINKKINK